MAHLVFIEDAQGDVIDAEAYCSDYCAKTSPAYAGWNGCHQLTGHCTKCGVVIIAGYAVQTA